MSDSKDQANTDRRSFLKLAGAGTVLGGAALVAGTTAAEAVEAPGADDGRLYKETAHVKAYYNLARF